MSANVARGNSNIMISRKTLAIAAAFFISWVVVIAINPVVGAFLGVFLGVICIFLIPSKKIYSGILEQRRKPKLTQQPKPSTANRMPSDVKQHVWRRDGGRGRG